MSSLGFLHFLHVNNAGNNRLKPMTEVLPEDYSAVMDLNVRAAFFVAQAVAARMIADAVSGSLIHVGS